jgi:alcohol dehydrogenase class IV
MKPFKFQARTKFIAGPDSVQQLGSEVTTLGTNNVLVVTDQGIVNAGLLDAVLVPLEKAGIKTAVYDQVAPNPTDQTALAGAARAKESGAQAVIGLGGGSPIDAAKAIAVMTTNDGQFEDYCSAGVDPWPHPPLPIVAVPTTAGTGAEVSAAAMINLPAQGRKVDMFGSSILPQVTIADAKLTMSLPPRLTAWTGIDALSHAVEAYVCVGANPVSDALAEGAIKLVADNIRRAYQHGSDVEARHNMLVASAMAVLAASGAGGLGVIHSLAQTLGGFYDLPHGLTIAVCFPYGLAYNLPTVPEKYATVSRLLGADTGRMTLEESAQSVITTIQQLNSDLNIDDTFETMNICLEDVPQLAEYAMLDGCTPTNPRSPVIEDFVELFQGGFSNRFLAG